MVSFEASASCSLRSRRQGCRLNPPLWLPDKEIRALWKEAGQHRRASEMLSWKAHCRPSTHPAFPEYLTTKTANNRIPVSNKTLLVYPKVYLPHLQMYAFVTKLLPINPATRSRTKLIIHSFHAIFVDLRVKNENDTNNVWRDGLTECPSL